MKYVAILEEGIYRGVQPIEDDALTPEHVQVPQDCDLAPGHYVWNVERQTFISTLPAMVARDAASAEALSAIALALIAVKKTGVALPAATEGWLEDHLATVDFRYFAEKNAVPKADYAVASAEEIP